ncbi:uncharacterized protein L969DRAFT_14455 [Mixia osmundae IAM 14324]|uniref:Proteasome assembly chaperone 1 n=1 Tax=Mixia osmundae (strain CBS 9802 / IAM 14324 / JCM 22182 / KY 12970) TaxID=764103 RepID=G7E099_MIXOS|nr:uncharacterized protein L969DRAFT_14455 [Mixia osmundae IAM 14324]KEI42249.1 hypothetical protein L969DRAFT_14455 [Mixia osmundae IAM 14324]GAA96259.1 hypothetical protein E5Q_02923 [Mixia osmundae IAM 14324]
MDLNEPFSTAAPARYTIESDSSQSEFEDDNAGRQLRTKPAKTPREAKSFSLSAVGAEAKLSPAGELVLLLGEAGSAWSKHLQSAHAEGASVQAGSVQVASLAQLGATTAACYASTSGIRLDDYWGYASTILEATNPERLTVIDSYAAPYYIGGGQASERNVRYLQSDDDERILPTAALTYEPPNVLQGLTAAIVTQATELSIPATVLLFPSDSLHLSNATSIDAAIREARPSEIYDFGQTEEATSALASPAMLHELSRTFKWSELGWTASLASPSRADGYDFLRIARKANQQKAKADLSSLYL